MLVRDYVFSLGLPASEIPCENIHFLDWSRLSSNEQKRLLEADVNGAYVPEDRQILVYQDSAQEVLMGLAETMVHEMLHGQSYSSFQRGVGGKARLRRIGFEIVTSEGDVYFRDIDEAVITELTKRFFQQYVPNIDVLKADLEARQRFLLTLPEEVRQGAAEEIAYVGRYVTTLEQKEYYRTEVHEFPYKEERKRFWRLVEDLHARNAQQFENRDVVFRLFVDAIIGGRLLPVARLVERTYGKGSFRKLGEGRAKPADHSLAPP